MLCFVNKSLPEHRDNICPPVPLWLLHSAQVKSVGEREVVPLGAVNCVHLGEGLGVKEQDRYNN